MTILWYVFPCENDCIIQNYIYKNNHIKLISQRLPVQVCLPLSCKIRNLIMKNIRINVESINPFYCYTLAVVRTSVVLR